MVANIDRRQFLRYGAGLAGVSTAGAFGLQMAAAGSAAGAVASDYKALVCIYLYGGNDANNMVLATDSDSWSRYASARNQGQDPIALMPVGAAAVAPGQVSSITGRTSALGKPENWGGVLPIVPRRTQAVPAGTSTSRRTFALHPCMGPAKALFDAGRLAILANVGTLISPTTKTQFKSKTVQLPASLFSHNDQQSTWQAGAVEGAKIGWGGRMGDILSSMNGSNTIFTAINTSGTAVFLAGNSIMQYPLSTSDTPALKVNGAGPAELFGSKLAPDILRNIVTDTMSGSDLGRDYASVMARSVGSADVINAAFSTGLVSTIARPPVFTNPMGVVETNSVAMQLYTVARMIASGPSFGLKRQVFMVNGGRYDSHDAQNASQSNNLAKLAQALSYFDEVLANVGGKNMRENVTTFTASDFSRTFNTNGDGTDHGWGGHHLIMGGAVRGGDIYGQYPTLGMEVNGFSNPDLVGGAFIPTTSVDQYAATLGTWFGVGKSDLNSIFPNLRNFSSANIGFV